MNAVGYARVSTDEQGQSGLSLAHQRAVITDEAARRGWNLVNVFSDNASGRSLAGRPGLDAALGAMESGDAHALIVSKLDRLSRSTKDFSTLLERAARKGWSPVVLDLGIDTTTPSGEFVANVMASLAQWERRVIGQRTREALAQKRNQGAQLGRPPQLRPATVARIQHLRADGFSYSRIAGWLNDKGVPTAQGGKRWYPATVRKVLLSSVKQQGLT